MLRKLNTRLILPFHRYASSQQPEPEDKRSVLQREFTIKKEQWTPEGLIEPPPKLSEREIALEEQRQRIREFQEPPDAMENRWKSKFSNLYSSERDMDLMIWAAQPWDIRPSNLIRMWKDWKIRRQAYLQSYMKERFQLVGHDLGVAHFILYRHGKIK